ncbi:hypothetical protein REH59_17955 [Pseudomonas sp. BO3-4]|uniref:hypothetical protein n=1 Tax=Pseudomonas sp. BO3-4 TaxID=3094916 RepID=UPI002A59E565|nr:hypothetical protein [Pseudomonas sp. BO3-4]WPO28098.1 hypothetical protein REH59_17955 [Pseudomonas sp. BO3-4]
MHNNNNTLLLRAALIYIAATALIIIGVQPIFIGLLASGCIWTLANRAGYFPVK